MKALQIESLTKRYGRIVGCRDIAFDVSPGEIFGCLGPNGSGKTTMIRCIMGLLRPTAGGCRVFGEPVQPGRATQHARIGYLPGDYRIWPGISARRALTVLADLGQTPDTEQRRETLAERLDLDLDRRIGDLSRGNRQKVGVICAFQHQPDLLILDEPTIGLDPLVRQTVLELIRDAAAAGAAVLLSSHDLAEVAAVCGRAAILRRGRLIELAPISQIVQQGAKRLKVWFVGQTPAIDTSAAPAGARIVSTENNAVEIACQGHIDSVLKWIARYPVERIATPETSLEEAFMQYYRENPPTGEPS